MTSPPRVRGQGSRGPASGAGTIRFREPSVGIESGHPGQVALLFLLIALSLTCYCLASRFVVTAVVVQGRSMMPTLTDGQRCFLNRFVFRCRQPRRGELVVVRDIGHSDFAVKRIVGMPRDAMLLKDGQVYVNGQRFEEPYLAHHTKTSGGDFKVQLIMLGRDRYFVMGDNRPNSEDSRYYGPLARHQIIGLLSP